MGRRAVNQTELARRLGVPQPWVNRRVKAHTPITADDLELIADALGVPLSTFFSFDVPGPDDDGGRRAWRDSNAQPSDPKSDETRHLILLAA